MTERQLLEIIAPLTPHSVEELEGLMKTNCEQAHQIRGLLATINAAEENQKAEHSEKIKTAKRIAKEKQEGVTVCKFYDEKADATINILFRDKHPQHKELKGKLKGVTNTQEAMRIIDDFIKEKNNKK